MFNRKEKHNAEGLIDYFLLGFYQFELSTLSMRSVTSSIEQDWKQSPIKDPPLSVVLKDHLGKGSGTDRFHPTRCYFTYLPFPFLVINHYRLKLMNHFVREILKMLFLFASVAKIQSVNH